MAFNPGSFDFWIDKRNPLLGAVAGTAGVSTGQFNHWLSKRAYMPVYAESQPISATAVTWIFEVDWDRDGNWDDANEDISAYVMGARWNLGMRRAYQDTADEARLQLTLRNDDKRFSPEYASSPYYGELLPQRLLRVRSVYNGGTISHWQGWVERIQPEWNENGSNQATMQAVGLKQYLSSQEAHLELMEDVTADEVILAVMEEISLVRRRDRGGCWAGWGKVKWGRARMWGL